MNKITAALASTASLAIIGVSTTGAVAPVPAAQATTCPIFGDCFGGVVEHNDRDFGYDQPIFVICDWGDAFRPDGTPRGWPALNAARKLVEEGTSSKQDCGIDTDVIVVRDNEEVHCALPTFNFDASGPHKITDAAQFTCLVQRD